MAHLFNRGQTPADAIKFQELLQLGQVDPGLFQQDPDFASGQLIGRSVGAALLGRFGPPSVNVQAAQAGEHKKQMLRDFAASEGADDPAALALLAIQLDMPEIAIDAMKIDAANKRAERAAATAQRKVEETEAAGKFTRRVTGIGTEPLPGGGSVIFETDSEGRKDFKGVIGPKSAGVNITIPTAVSPGRTETLDIADQIKGDEFFDKLTNETGDDPDRVPHRNNFANAAAAYSKELLRLADVRGSFLDKPAADAIAIDTMKKRLKEEDRFDFGTGLRDRLIYDRNIEVPAVTETFDKLFGKVAAKPKKKDAAKQVKPVIPEKRIRVRQKSDGATGTIPENEFDADIYERL